ncbi:MAG: hypothetical protein HQL46_03580 [Gammaproteobacteria bacterium]|nr:hypothetical protein [Gammaproteobacteria bacterium]
MNRRRGIALIEILISTLIISTGVLAIILLMAQLKQGSDEVHIDDQASQLAYNKLESFKNTIIKSQFNALQSGSEKVKVSSAREFEITWKVSSISQNEKKVQIKVHSDHIETEINYLLLWNDPALSVSVVTHGEKEEEALLSFSELDGASNKISTIDNTIVQKYDFHSLGQVIVDDSNKWYFRGNNSDIWLSGQFKQGSDISQLVQLISGRVFVQLSKKTNFISDNFLEISGGGHCYYVGDFNDIGLSNWAYIHFQCVGALDWQGKLGVLSIQQENFFCPSSSKKYFSYQSINEKLQLSGINLNQQLQDFIVVGDDKISSCDNALEEINQNLINQNSIALIEKNKFKQSIVIDDQSVVSFSGTVNLDTIYPIHKLNFKITSLGNSYPIADYACQAINSLPDNVAQFHCAMILKNNMISDWQGQLEVNLNYLNNTQGVSSCQVISDIDTGVKNNYQLSCKNL